MALRKASSYSKKIARPFTRKSNKKSKAYIKVVPHSKIVKLRVGDQKAYEEGKHKYFISLISQEATQIRDTALEAGRMLLHKLIEEKAPGQYYMEVKVYPHHMLRENKISSGAAGADRTSTGMTQSFGVVIGRAALVKSGQQIFFVSCVDDRVARIARDSMSSIRSKLPCKTKILFEKLVKN